MRWLIFVLVVALVAAGAPAQELREELAKISATPSTDARRSLARRLVESLKDPEPVLAAIRDWRQPEVEPGDLSIEASPMLLSTIHVARIHRFVPASLRAPAPLILFLHGAGGSGREGIETWRAIATELGAIVVAPERRDSSAGHVYARYWREAVLDVLHWAQAHLPIDPDRILLTGVSSGAHLAWDLALRHPDRWVAVAPMIGAPRLLPDRGQHNLRLLENLVPVPIRDLQGEQDDPLLVANLRFAFAELKRLRARDAALVTFPDHGHGYDFGTVDWRAWLQDLRRPARPVEVVLRTARLDEARSFWLEVTGFAPNVAEDFAPRLPADFERKPAEVQARLVTQEGEKSLARVRARMTAPGRFSIDSKGVRSLRLLLDASMFVPDEPVAVTWNGKVHRVTPRVSAVTLACEWVERLDPGFLPIAGVELRERAR